MDLKTLLRAGIIFFFGFLSANLLSIYFLYGLENPVMKTLGFSKFTTDSAPFDFVKENQIEIFEDRIVIHVPNGSIGRYAPTGSMKPVLDENSNGIRIIPKSEKDIHIGDIITFKKDSFLIIHRVVDIGTDKDGTYFVTKGDNNNIDDGKVRFEDIEYITIGIIW